VADELDEGERIVDSPVNRNPEPKQEAKQEPKQKPKQAKTMKILMEKAMLAYGMDQVKERFDMLLTRAGCTVNTVTEEKYDLINGWIESDMKKGAA
jgi:hypothetical protein